MDDSIELKIIGITYNQIESGVYALVLEDIEMKRRLAIVIGYPEAQSIECKLQNVKTPRPLTHDLLASMLDTLGATLIRVDIHRLPAGPYAGKLTIENVFGDIQVLDARSSDAIALAIRVGAPIYANKELLDKEGFVQKKNESKTTSVSNRGKFSPNRFARHSLQQLEDLLSQYVLEENYEEAAKIKTEIDRRNKENEELG